MLRWFAFTLAVGLLPFGFSMLAQYVREPNGTSWGNSPELLFFTVMVCASGVGELLGSGSLPAGRRLPGWRENLLSGAPVVLLLTAVASASLYGMYVYHDLSSPGAKLGIDCRIFADPGDFPGTAGLSADAIRGVAGLLNADCKEWVDIQTNLFRLSIGIALVFGTVATAVEWTRTRR